MMTTNAKYATVECPLCSAMVGERCRNPKTTAYLAEDQFHGERWAIVEQNIERAARRREEYATVAAQQLAEAALTSPHEKMKGAFLEEYAELCRRHGLVFARETGYGETIITNANREQHLTDALTTRLVFDSNVDEGYESFGEFLSKRD